MLCLRCHTHTHTRTHAQLSEGRDRILIGGFSIKRYRRPSYYGCQSRVSNRAYTTRCRTIFHPKRSRAARFSRAAQFLRAAEKTEGRRRENSPVCVYMCVYVYLYIYVYLYVRAGLRTCGGPGSCARERKRPERQTMNNRTLLRVIALLLHSVRREGEGERREGGREGEPVFT